MIISDNTMIDASVSVIKAKAELYNGSTLVQVCTCGDVLQDFSIERIGEAGKFFGFGICHSSVLKLIDLDREINITKGNSFINYFGTEEGNFISPYPTFYVESVDRDETSNTLSVTTYDLLYKANEHTFSELDIIGGTIGDVANACADVLGIEGTEIINVGRDETCFDTEFIDNINFDGTETLKEVLDDIAEVTQTIYYISSQNNLVFKRLDKDGDSVFTIDKNNYFSLKSGENRRLGTIYHNTELGDDVFVSTAQTGSTQYVRDNGFWELREDIGTLLDNAIAVVGGLTIGQFNCSWLGNYLLEIGDKIDIIAEDNSTITSYMLNDYIFYDGTLSEKTEWSYVEDNSETADNPTSLGEALNKTFARVDKVNQEVSIVAGRAEANESSISSILINTDSITQSVDGLRNDLDNETANREDAINKLSTQVTQDMENLKVQINNTTVDNVTTSTGYVFDADGLTISKTGKEMTTQITEDGMVIYRDSDKVLIVNNEGVSAKNLHASTWLIIGATSRFEDYYKNGELRTGLFWVGG